MRILRLRLPVADLATQRHFYSSTIGFPVIIGNDQSCEIEVGQSTLTLVRSDVAGGQHFAFHIAENLFDESVEWVAGRATMLSENGQRVFTGCFGREADRVYFADVEDNILEFIAYHDTDTASDSPFGPSHILEVGEVGLVTADAKATAASLGKWLGVPSRGDEAFSIAGDRDGMLVFVNPGYHWMPTEIPATAITMSVHVDSAPNGETPILGEPWQVLASEPPL